MPPRRRGPARPGSPPRARSRRPPGAVQASMKSISRRSGSASAARPGDLAGALPRRAPRSALPGGVDHRRLRGRRLGLEAGPDESGDEQDEKTASTATFGRKSSRARGPRRQESPRPRRGRCRPRAGQVQGARRDRGAPPGPPPQGEKSPPDREEKSGQGDPQAPLEPARLIGPHEHCQKTQGHECRTSSTTQVPSPTSAPHAASRVRRSNRPCPLSRSVPGTSRAPTARECWPTPAGESKRRWARRISRRPRGSRGLCRFGSGRRRSPAAMDWWNTIHALALRAPAAPGHRKPGGGSSPPAAIRLAAVGPGAHLCSAPGTWNHLDRARGARVWHAAEDEPPGGQP